MKISPVKIANTCANKAVDSCNSVSDFVSNKLNNLDKSFDTFVKDTPFSSLKGKVNKNTLIGAGILLAGIGLAVKSVKSIGHELKRIKSK